MGGLVKNHIQWHFKLNFLLLFVFQIVPVFKTEKYFSDNKTFISIKPFCREKIFLVINRIFSFSVYLRKLSFFEWLLS